MKKTNSSLNLLALAGVKPYEEQDSEEYMNPKQIEHLKKILQAWYKQIIEDTNKTVEHMQSESANCPDDADRASREEEFTLELRNRDRERKLRKKIENTLHRIDNDEDFGYCLDCGVPIGLKRLQARPTAELCIDCKTLAEKREKQINH